MASEVLNSAKPESTRQYLEFPPTVWGNYFTSFGSEALNLDKKVEEEVQSLKEEVKNVLAASAEKLSHKLKLIDSIQRLGVIDHFQSEIQDLLEQISSTYADSIIDANDHNLYSDALLFRLLRQQGYKVSSDIFKKYVDDEGKFKEFLAKDVHGLLSLYEAAYFSVHGEDILDEALNFVTGKLKAIVGHLSYPLSEEVMYALKHPLRRGMLRLEASHFMPIYNEDPSHNKALLIFAKLDYNLLQKLHLEELAEVSRWWKDLDFPTKLPFARDRIAECYFWAIMLLPERQYSVGRRFMAKLVQLTSILDDIYDLHGTPEELKLLTDAIERWDVSAQDQLPDNLKFFYVNVLLLYSNFERDQGIENESFRMIRAKEGVKGQAKAYFGEANWRHAGYIPSIDEYYEFALSSTGYHFFSANAYLCMGDAIPKEAFDWLFTRPKILREGEIIGRLMNDIVEYKLERVGGNEPSAQECYIKQYGVSEEEAYTALRKRVDDAWKYINECCLETIEFSKVVLSPMVNLSRASHVYYRDEDGYTIGGGQTKLYITSLVVEPVPL